MDEVRGDSERQITNRSATCIACDVKNAVRMGNDQLASELDFGESVPPSSSDMFCERDRSPPRLARISAMIHLRLVHVRKSSRHVTTCCGARQIGVIKVNTRKTGQRPAMHIKYFVKLELFFFIIGSR